MGLLCFWVGVIDEGLHRSDARIQGLEPAAPEGEGLRGVAIAPEQLLHLVIGLAQAPFTGAEIKVERGLLIRAQIDAMAGKQRCLQADGASGIRAIGGTA